ncbi:MAG: hypothetical protein SFT91_06365 [Rickettsiaceae bacterium]|nr:hypothetical protein [Rickettsiaceae bacterium]
MKKTNKAPRRNEANGELSSAIDMETQYFSVIENLIERGDIP